MRKKIYNKLIETFMDYSCFNEIKSRISYLTLQNYVEIQQKGGYKKIKTYKYLDYRFRTVLTGNEEEVLFMIDKNNRCFILKIDLEYPGLAILEGFGNEPKCSVPKLPKDGGGSIMICFLLDYVKRYLPNIKKIELTDNSKIRCGETKVNLFDLYTLTNGISWYGKFGFVPENREMRKYYKKNYYIMNKIRTSNVWLDIKEILKKYKIKNNNGLLKNDLKKIFKIDCRYYNKIFKYLLRKYDLTSMYGENFILYMKNYKSKTTF